MTWDTDHSRVPGYPSASGYESARVAPLMFQFLFYTIENAVDELRGFLTAEAPRDLDGFVNHNGLRSLLIVKKLLSSQPQQIAIDGRHSVQPPVFGVPLN